MRIARFSPADRPDETPRTGLVVADRVIDLATRAPELPGDPAALLARRDEVRARLEEIARDPGDAPALEAVRLHAPVVPRQCLAVGLNYAAHAKEFTGSVPEHPTVFSKQVNCLAGPHADVHLPRVSDALDYEGELVLVIGRRCRHVPPTRAHEVIGAWCVGNDFSVRDWQLRSGQFTIGKSFDTHGPFGPWLVTADEIADYRTLTLRTLVNGELRQEASTGAMLFPCEELIAHLTAAMTLEPGDLVFTGTPAGIGFAETPPRYLRAGDRVQVEIEGLGAIENRVVPEPDATAFID